MGMKLESKLSVLAQMLDNHLENCFGQMYSLFPNRPKRGETANNAYDGLFSAHIQFTLGYGSSFGRGYVVSIDIRTLEKVSSESRKAIEDEAFGFLTDNIDSVFPERKLSVVHDGINGQLIKIIGDFKGAY